MKNTLAILCGLLLPSHVLAETVAKKAWEQQMVIALQTNFCQSDSYYRQCFSVSAEQCEETASSVTLACLSQSGESIPDPLEQPADGTHWGREVGTCAGSALEAALVQHKLKAHRCNDASNWLPSKDDNG